MQHHAVASSPARKPTADKHVSLSILKAASILKEIGRSREERSLTEIANATSLSMTVCFRMLATLERERFVEKNPSTSRYKLGLGLVALARQTLQQQPIGTLTAKLMADAARELHDVALLMIPDGDRALCIDRKAGDSPIITLGTHVGSRPALHAGGGPFAILAFSSDEFIDDYLSRPLEKCTARTVTAPNKVRARIREARERGYAVGDEDLYEHVVAVGMPVFGADHALLGSISVGGVKPQYDQKRIAQVAAWLLAHAKKL